MKAEFFPRVSKADFFELGYVAEKSSHSRGSAVDLTIITLPRQQPSRYLPGQRISACSAPFSQRFRDGGVDMGTGWDCMDQLSHNDNPPSKIGVVAWSYRTLLQLVMEKQGFEAYQPEWWHFTLKKEAFPETYFNFSVSAR